MARGSMAHTFVLDQLTFPPATLAMQGQLGSWPAEICSPVWMTEGCLEDVSIAYWLKGIKRERLRSQEGDE